MTDNALVRLSAAAQALVEAKDLNEVKQIRDLAQAAGVYARAAKLGLDAQNTAAEIKLRAERKAGEMLAQLEKKPGKRTDITSSNDGRGSEYHAVLDDTGTSRQEANRWQTEATLPEEVFEAHIAGAKAERRELTTAGVLEEVRSLTKPTMPHVANNSGNNEWYTPADYIASARVVMGNIDLDPASSPIANEVVRADTFYTAEDDGLMHAWAGSVWMNPPYASELIGRFCTKLALHVKVADVPEAIVLVNNATETAWFAELISVASAVCFTRGRIRFWSPDRESATPLQGQAIVYIGSLPLVFCEEFKRFGWMALL